MRRENATWEGKVDINASVPAAIGFEGESLHAEFRNHIAILSGNLLMWHGNLGNIKEAGRYKAF